ncbi:MAG: DNA recombination protein RmuC [Campylobacterota bacterium]|nr:DNA recombination protein RmuC [Campylobacterota bacterium]
MIEILGVVCIVLVGVAIYLYKRSGDISKQYEIEKAISSEKIKYLSSLIQESKNNTLSLEYQNQQQQLESIKDKELISQLQTKLKEQNKAMHEKLNILQHNEDKLKVEFKNLASEILDNNSKKFSVQNSENLSLILNPMKQQINEFKKKVEDVYDKEARDRSILSAELKTLKELNNKISQDAINLTNALKGQNKTQGSWGEMVLEKVLESSGLRKGEEYLREEFLTSNEGKGYRPDVIVNLPNNRQVIIDSKTSLSSYEQYTSTQDESEKDKFLKTHLISINNHINDLSDKKYEKLNGINTLDFIFMFIPIESALMLALENDKELFDKAFKKKIVLVSPTTLLVALKAVENSWRYEKQAQSTTEVIRLAEKLYNKVRTFIEDFEKVGKHLNTAQKSYDDAHNKLTQGRDNIVRQIEVFKEKSNINPTKQIPQELTDSAMTQEINNIKEENNQN